MEDAGRRRGWRHARWVGLVLALYLALVVGLIAIGDHTELPDEHYGLSSPSGLGTAAWELVGRGGTTDYLADYASAQAMRRGGDAYETLGPLMLREHDVEWPLIFSNPHPPTQLTLVLPFTTVRYEWSLSGWAVAMVGVFMATFAVMGVPLRISVVGGLIVALVYPGAYGIGNPVPVIGLGMAMAYRFRDAPGLAGIGLALAISPKVSGAVLLAPFVVARRYRAVVICLVLLALLAVIPMAFQPDIWSRYLDAGVEAIRLNVNDNALLTRVGLHWGLGRPLTLALLGVCSALLALRTRDLYWPLCWLAVAALPILWMYSLLTLIPLLVFAVQRGGRWTTPLVIGAAGLAVASPPLGEWPSVVAPTVIILAFAALWSARPTSMSEGLWLSPGLESRLGLDRLLRLDQLGTA